MDKYTLLGIIYGIAISLFILAVVSCIVRYTGVFA